MLGSRAAVTAAVIAVAAVTALPAGSADSTFPGRNGLIVYAHPMGGQGWLMSTMNPDGSGKRLLTGEGGLDPTPAPDGKRFVVRRQFSLYVHDPRRRPVNRRFARGWSASWSPNGKRIAFVESGRGIVATNPDGTRKKILIKNTSAHTYDEPEWSPNGRRLVVIQERTGPVDTQIYTARSDGTALRALSDPQRVAAYRDASWSPDGSRIAYARCARGEKNPSNGDAIWVPSADGTQAAAIATFTRADCVRSITWSPDGRQIAFYRDTLGTLTNDGIWIMSADGSQLRRILASGGEYGFAWQRARP